MATRSQVTVTKTGKFAEAGHILRNAAGPFCQLRQTVTGDGIDVGADQFSDDLGGLTRQGTHLEGYASTRTALLRLAEGVTIEQVEKALAEAPNSCIYLRISDDVLDVIEPRQKAGIGKNGITAEQYEQSSKVTNPSTGEELGYFQVGYYSKTFKADVDLRVPANNAAPAIAVAAPAASTADITL